MTPQLYIKLQNQVQRQSTELQAINTSILVLDPEVSLLEQQVQEIKSRQTKVQSQLDILRQTEGSDTSTLDAELAVINSELEPVEKQLSQVSSERSTLQSKADALQASITACQSELTASSLTAEDITAYQQSMIDEAAAKTEQLRLEQLWQAAHDYEKSYISGVGLSILAVGVLLSKPKALAVSAWSAKLWNETYYPRKLQGSTDRPTPEM